MPDNFRDLFTGNLPQGFFDNGQLPEVPFYGDTQGASSKDMIGGALNAGGMFVPGLNVASGLYNFGSNVMPGFERGQFGNVDTNYQMGGGDSGNFQAPQPSSHDSIFGSQRLGNTIYGGGLSGWLGDLLGRAAGGISTWGNDKIEALPNTSFAPMSVPASPAPYGQQVQIRNEPTYTGTVTDPGTPDFSQMEAASSQPDPVSQPWQGISSMADLMGTPWYSDTRDAAFPNFMAGAGFGGAGYGYGGGGGSAGGWNWSPTPDNNGGWGQ